MDGEASRQLVVEVQTIAGFVDEVPDVSMPANGPPITGPTGRR